MFLDPMITLLIKALRSQGSHVRTITQRRRKRTKIETLVAKQRAANREKNRTRRQHDKLLTDPKKIRRAIKWEAERLIRLKAQAEQRAAGKGRACSNAGSSV